MPFSFMFNGGLYSTVYVSANGFLTFGTAPAGNNYSPISGAAAIAGVLSPWGGDGSGQFNVGGRTSVLSYATLGSAPNRTFVVEWKDWRHAYSTSTTNATYLNFQVRLDETTNIVTYSYGPSGMSIGSTNANTTRQIGIRGATNTDFLNRTNGTTVLWNNSTAGGANSSTQAFSSVNATPGRPTNPTNYIFTPPAAPTVTAFSPASGCPGTTITIDGTGFTGATAANVQIGGVAVASITSITATQIVAVSGGGNTGAVSVTRAGGTGSSATNFTFDSPAVPGSPSTTALNPGGFTVNWSASAGATSYIIDVSTSNTFATFVTGFNGLDVGNVTSYVVTGLASNTTYYWRAVAALHGVATVCVAVLPEAHAVVARARQ